MNAEKIIAGLSSRQADEAEVFGVRVRHVSVGRLIPAVTPGLCATTLGRGACVGTVEKRGVEGVGVTAREHLVVVLPGIGGSVLARPGHRDDVVWSGGFGDVGNVLLWPERLSIGEHEWLEPVGLIRTRKAFGVWTAIPGYDGVLRRLGELPGAVVDDGSPCGYTVDATVVGVPYDFRRSIVEAADRLDYQVRSRLAHLWPGGGDRPRVVIVAHSLGGLVARYWLAQQENWRLCRALITLGTPHRGAPKALDVLANGSGCGVCGSRARGQCCAGGTRWRSCCPGTRLCATNPRVRESAATPA